MRSAIWALEPCSCTLMKSISELTIAASVPWLDVAADLRIPIIVASGYQCWSEAAQITQFAPWCPEVPVILTNGGQYNISGLGQIDAGLALQIDNVYVQTSGVYRDDWIERVVSEFGPERLLFASSAPLMDFAYELKRVELAHVAEDAKSLMLGGNAIRLFALGATRNGQSITT